MNRYEELEAFVRTIEAGSFTAAAGQLHVAKSAVTKRVQDLEQRLGVQLIIRSTRKLSLTDAGQDFFQRAIRLLADWKEAEAAISDAQTKLTGSIRLAMPLSFGLSYLGGALIRFQDLHPDISFDVDLSDRLVDLVAEGMDLAIRIGELPDSSLIARRIAPVTTHVVASPDYISRNGAPTAPEDLIAHPELRYSTRRQSRWSYRTPDGRSGTIEMKPRMLATNGGFLRDAAIAGQGVALLPDFIISDAVRSGKLVCLLPDCTWSELAVYAVYPPTRHLSARVRALIDFLVGQCSEHAPWSLSDFPSHTASLQKIDD